MFKLVTNNPVAIESPDHLSTLGPEPTGGPTKDNSKNPNFNRKLYNLFKGNLLWILDLGCSGGGFVEDCLNDGHIAIGLEGSDYSLIRKRAAWATIPESLFTCDCTKPFQIEYENKPVEDFDVVTSWEFAEHIPAKDWPQLCDNVRNHLKLEGLWILSVSQCPGDMHQLIKSKDWWVDMFEKEGFINQQDLVQYFDKDFVRTDDMSFHLVLKRAR